MFQIHRRKYQSYFLTHHKIEDDCHMVITIQLCFRWASQYPRCNTFFRAVAASFPISLTMRTTITWSHLPSTNQPTSQGSQVEEKRRKTFEESGSMPNDYVVCDREKDYYTWWSVKHHQYHHPQFRFTSSPPPSSSTL